MKKIKVGIIFGGSSKEREVSFAGGRTVYDNLNKSIFEPVPVFVDSFNQFILLNWEFIYKGTIRDFYPPVEFVEEDFQVYAESLGHLPAERQLALIHRIGEKIEPGVLKNHFDFAFLCLHGPYGEDGKIQGCFDYLGIPYSGSGILPSAIGIDKIIQKKLLLNAGFASPGYSVIKRKTWFSSEAARQDAFHKIKAEPGFPLVVKSPTQGSSIGIEILFEPDEAAFRRAVNKSFFVNELTAREWTSYSEEKQSEYIKTVTDIRLGVGIPVNLKTASWSRRINHPRELLRAVSSHFEAGEETVWIEGLDAESEVLVEGFIEGREFSCIVIQDEEGKPVALPPTEIRKGSELFDYRSKYLPGLSRKITPIDLPADRIRVISRECEKAFNALHMNVYARMDGFITKDNEIFLNDINTTSGMMPSSFFFHQAAEIGLNPSQFLTYIIFTSLNQRVTESKNKGIYDDLLANLKEAIHKVKAESAKKLKVAVLLGGYSTERHVSVDSGRNVYEKLASSSKYEPIPVFFTGNENEHILYQIPVNILLKDNADDIKEKIAGYKVHDVVKEIMEKHPGITTRYSSMDSLANPKRITYKELAEMVDVVFISLHGRPGEDGAVQAKLDEVGLAYNGSGVESSRITIDKFRTNELLKQHGFLVAEHMLVSSEDWMKDKKGMMDRIKRSFVFPFIAKPVDDGCSSAVKKIKNMEELEAFSRLIFRQEEELEPQSAGTLHIKPKEEFPRKKVFLIEELISKKGAKHFLEITGGMLTRFGDKEDIVYEVFEASEALAEGEVLSLEEKFLAGQGQNITPARYAADPKERQRISDQVKKILGAAAKLLNIHGYTRIDAFVRVYENGNVEVIFVEVNSLPAMTPATCIFHQAAINQYKPYDFIDHILSFALSQKSKQVQMQ